MEPRLNRSNSLFCLKQGLGKGFRLQYLHQGKDAEAVAQARASTRLPQNNLETFIRLPTFMGEIFPYLMEILRNLKK